MDYLRKRIILIISCIGLIVSCKKEKTEVVVPEVKFVYSSKEIITAIDKGDLKKVKECIAKGEDPNGRCKGYTRGGREEGQENISDRDWTLLMYAVFHNESDIVKFLLEKKADINAVNAVGHSALFLACANNEENMGLLLIENGADVNIGKDDDGMNALQWALSYELNDLSSKLIDKGANVNTFSTETGRSVLMEAFFSDTIKPAIAHRIIDLGAEVHFIDPRNKETPLMLACMRNDSISVKKLINKGAYVNLESKAGYTALTYAAGNDFEEASLLRYLVSKGAKINDQNVPLIDAAQSGSLKKVKFLVENGADVNKRRPINGLSALYEAGFSAYLDIAIYLINNGANVNIENFDGESVLCRSIGSEKGSFKMVQLLIDNGANVNHIDKSDKSTVLMKAAQYNLPDIVALLIEKGASKEGVNTYGKTAKMYAEESATRTGDDKILTFFE